MSEDCNQNVPSIQEYPKYVVVCMSDFCNKYGIRESVRNKFGLSNQVQSIDKECFERFKNELKCVKRHAENCKTDTGHHKKQHYEAENSLLEGSTLEVSSQDLLYSQEERPPDLIVSEDTGFEVTQQGDICNDSITLLESQNNEGSQEVEPELLQSEEFFQVISSPGV